MCMLDLAGQVGPLVLDETPRIAWVRCRLGQTGVNDSDGLWTESEGLLSVRLSDRTQSVGSELIAKALGTTLPVMVLMDARRFDAGDFKAIAWNRHRPSQGWSVAPLPVCVCRQNPSQRLNPPLMLHNPPRWMTGSGPGDWPSCVVSAHPNGGSESRPRAVQPRGRRR